MWVACEAGRGVRWAAGELGDAQSRACWMLWGCRERKGRSKRGMRASTAWSSVVWVGDVGTIGLRARRDWAWAWGVRPPPTSPPPPNAQQNLHSHRMPKRENHALVLCVVHATSHAMCSHADCISRSERAGSDGGDHAPPATHTHTPSQRSCMPSQPQHQQPQPDVMPVLHKRPGECQAHPGLRESCVPPRQVSQLSGQT